MVKVERGHVIFIIPPRAWIEPRGALYPVELNGSDQLEKLGPDCCCWAGLAAITPGSWRPEPRFQTNAPYGRSGALARGWHHIGGFGGVGHLGGFGGGSSLAALTRPASA
jgi:hypothetical protein